MTRTRTTPNRGLLSEKERELAVRLVHQCVPYLESLKLCLYRSWPAAELSRIIRKAPERLIDLILSFVSAGFEGELPSALKSLKFSVNVIQPWNWSGRWEAAEAAVVEMLEKIANKAEISSWSFTLDTAGHGRWFKDQVIGRLRRLPSALTKLVILEGSAGTIIELP
jgi:hypothetical protein